MSDSVIDLSAERRAREAAGGAITVSVIGSAISLLVGDQNGGAEATLDEESAERHIAAMRRAVEALRFMRPPVQVPLGRGRFALIDAVDAERVMAFCWHLKVKRSQPDRVYAQRTVRLTPGRAGKKTAIVLHRFIMNAGPGDVVDHISGDTLDNRRANLRLCTWRENATNVTRSKQQKRGGFKGVSFNKNAGKWQASICAGEILLNGKRKQLYLGLFEDPSKAARAYDAAALIHFGEFASLNFPIAPGGQVTASGETK